MRFAPLGNPKPKKIYSAGRPRSLSAGHTREKHAGRVRQSTHRRALGPTEPHRFTRFRTQFVVFGVATEYCVRCTADGLLRRGYRVSVVTDAVRGIDQEKAQQTLETLHSAGARFITTSEALALVGGSP